MNSARPSSRLCRIFGLGFPAIAALISTSLAQFNPIGFEGSTIYNIPYATTVGIPNGTQANTAFSYTFVDGNNLQSFNNAAAGIVDSDDGTGGSNSIPDYYKSPEFGWKLDGYQTTNNAAIVWNSFNSSYSGNGASIGEDYPGGIAGRQTDLGEAININQSFSPASGNLAKAPGLGEHFLDVHASTGVSTQLSLSFLATQSDTFFVTLAFGGRDANSQNYTGYYRLLDGATTVFSGSTASTPFQAWTPTDPANPSAGAVAATPTTNAGVTQKDWEYYKQTFAVTAGTNYTLQIMLPEELNFDFALGGSYSYTPGVVTNFSTVPEPATYGLMGFAVVGVLLVLRRRGQKPTP